MYNPAYLDYEIVLQRKNLIFINLYWNGIISKRSQAGITTAPIIEVNLNEVNANTTGVVKGDINSINKLITII